MNENSRPTTGRSKLIDLRKLEAFNCVVEKGSLTRAAAHLTIAQSALSRKIRELEDQIGVQLFHRDGRGVIVTEAGTEFYERAKALLLDADALVSNAQRSETGGNVTLGIPPSISHILLLPLLTRVRREYPGIRMRVVEGFSGHVQEWLLNGRIDIGVLYASRRMPTIIDDELVTEDMCLLGRAQNASLARPSITLEELSGLPLVLPSRPHGLRILVDDACARAKVNIDVQLEVDALTTIKSLAATGELFSILPFSAIGRELKTGELSASRIVEPVISRKLRLATVNKRLSPATREVASMIRQEVKDLIRDNHWYATIAGG